VHTHGRTDTRNSVDYVMIIEVFYCLRDNPRLEELNMRDDHGEIKPFKPNVLDRIGSSLYNMFDGPVTWFRGENQELKVYFYCII